MILCIFVGIVAAVSWAPRSGGPIDLRWDGGAYYILGTALASGEGYRMLSEPGTVLTTLHPPFLPLFVAAHQKVLQTTDPIAVGSALRFAIVLLSVAYMIAIYVLLRIYVQWPYALVAALLGLLQPAYTYFSDSLYAETIFGLFTVLFFIFYRRNQQPAYFALAALCAVLAYGVRSAGIALLAAWVADHLLRKQYKRAVCALLISMAPVLGWVNWIASVESSPEYQQPAYAYQRAPYVYFNISYARQLLTLADPSAPELGPFTSRVFIERIYGNLQRLPESIGRAMSSWSAPLYLSMPLFLLVASGFVLQVVRRQYLMVLYVVSSIAAMCLTPYHMSFVRYLLPLYPFFAVALFQLLAVLVQRSLACSRGFFALAGPVFVVLLVSATAVHELLGLRDLYVRRYHQVAYQQSGRDVQYRMFYYSPLGEAFDQALDWLQPRANEADIVAASDPQWVYLRTGLKSVLPPFIINGQQAQELVDTVPVRYLIAETVPRETGLGMYYRFTSALLSENPNSWNCIWASSQGHMKIYERVDGPSSSGEQSFDMVGR